MALVILAGIWIGLEHTVLAGVRGWRVADRQFEAIDVARQKLASVKAGQL